MEQDHGLVIFETDNGKTRLEISLINDTLWLSQQQIADLFDTDRTSVNRHIQNIYQTSELSENSTCADFAQVRQEGSRTVKRNIPFYNLDVIISVGYRVNSKKGTQFRIWASQILKDYLVKGYSVNEQKLQEQSKNIEELKSTLVLLEKTVSRQAGNIEQARDIAKVLVDFSQGLRILDDYDHGRLDAHGFHDRKLRSLIILNS